MQTIRQYIKNYKQLASNRDNHTDSTSHRHKHSSSNPRTHRKLQSSIEEQNSSDEQSNLYPRKISLPPIPQRFNKSPSIDLKRSCVLDRYLHSKSIVAGRSHRRSKTQEEKLRYKLSQRSQLLPNVQELRMRPMVKYFYHLENIRLAEKLLVIKPSRDINRSDQKKFFLKQRHYRDQISKGYQSIKSSQHSKRSSRKHDL